MPTSPRVPPGWPSDLARTVGAEVRRLRKARGWTAAELAEQLAAIGVDIGHAAIANLETDRRQTLGVHELIAFAAVLGVPPIALLVPDLSADVEMLPDRPTDAPRFALWLSGRYLDGQAHLRDDDPYTYETAAMPFDALARHLELAEDVETAETTIGGPAGDAFYLAAVERLRAHRREIARRYGAAEPPLPLDLEYLEPKVRDQDADATTTTEET